MIICYLIYLYAFSCLGRLPDNGIVIDGKTHYHHHEHFHYHDQQQPRAIKWNSLAPSYDLKGNSQFVEATFRFPNNSSFHDPITPQSSQVIEAKNVDGFVLTWSILFLFFFIYIVVGRLGIYIDDWPRRENKGKIWNEDDDEAFLIMYPAWYETDLNSWGVETPVMTPVHFGKWLKSGQRRRRIGTCYPYWRLRTWWETRRDWWPDLARGSSPTLTIALWRQFDNGRSTLHL